MAAVSTHTPAPHPISGVSVSLRDLLNLQRAADQIHLPPQRRVATHLAGSYLSSLRGRGIEFEEVRSYQPGDDIRTMDWRVTARTGKPHTKIFRAERERPVYILVDVGANMYFGTRITFKSCIAAQAAALFAWASVANRDRVGGILFGPQQHWEFKPAASHRGVARMLKMLADLSATMPQQFTHNPLGPAVQRLRRVARPGSTIYLISDFSGLDQDAVRNLTLLSQHNELYALHISDPIESSAPPSGRYNISDGTQTHILDTQSTQTRAHYAQIYQKRQQALTQLSQRARMMLLTLSTTDPVVQTLVQQLGGRT